MVVVLIHALYAYITAIFCGNGTHIEGHGQIAKGEKEMKEWSGHITYLHLRIYRVPHL